MAEAVARLERAGVGSAAQSRRAFIACVTAITAAVAAFLAVRLMAWPPHEDETLALFVGRESLGGVLGTVLDQRGGAPLHFLFAWAVVHTGGGLTALRAVSAVFAVASVPLIAVLASRLAGRWPALVATALAGASWMVLFHGVYGRMYSVFLVTSLVSYLVLLRAVDRNGGGPWAAWIAAILLCVAAHPYGAIVLLTQAVYVAVAGARRREASIAFGTALVLGVPFWRTDLVLAGRFDIGVGGGGAKLGSPLDVLRYLERTAGDFIAGYRPILVVVLSLAALGAWRLAHDRPRSALLAGTVILAPPAVLMLARFGAAAAPESRHLIFVLPFFLTLVGTGLVAVTRMLGRWGVAGAVVAVAVLVSFQVAWGFDLTPELYRGEAGARIAARGKAARWLAATSRRDDVLFGYDPLFLQAWRDGGRLSRDVIPRADPRLALEALDRSPEPLGRGVWVLDASDTGNRTRRLSVPVRFPQPRREFEARVFGPFLVIRTREPTGDVRSYLELARRAQLAGKSLGIADADTNLHTVLAASGLLANQERGRRRAASSRSSASR